MKNPLYKIMNDQKLTTHDLARLADISVSRVNQILRGDSARIKKGSRLYEALKMLDYDPNAIAKDYEDWREEQTKAIIYRVVNAG